MITKIKVEGMHCEGCANLIKYTLAEDVGMGGHVKSVKITDPSRHVGVAVLRDVTSAQLAKARQIINRSGNYHVIA